MQGTLLVTPQELKTTAGQFQSRASKIQQLTSEMMSQVKSLTSDYEGEASTAYINTFSRLEEDMNQIQAKIKEHVPDLNDMATAYESTENTAAEANAALQSDYI